jgi:hypothetical protein
VRAAQWRRGRGHCDVLGACDRTGQFVVQCLVEFAGQPRASRGGRVLVATARPSRRVASTEQVDVKDGWELIEPVCEVVEGIGPFGVVGEQRGPQLTVVVPTGALPEPMATTACFSPAITRSLAWNSPWDRQRTGTSV